MAIVNGVIPCDGVVGIDTLYRTTQVAVRQYEPMVTCCRHHCTVYHHVCIQRPVAWQRQLWTELRCSHRNKYE